MTQRYKVIMEYDGTLFSGFQRQPNARTVEGVLTKAVNTMAKMPDPALVIYGSGRTDAGVHALGQVAHFDFPFNIPVDSMRKGLNSLLPKDMVIISVELVDDSFHARYSVSGKRYLYRVDLNGFVDPFKRNYTGHWKFPIDMARLQQASQDLVGEHDFSSFVSSGSSARTNVRTIYEVVSQLDEVNHELIIEFYGNGFLYNQVRIMVGTLLDIAAGNSPVDDIQRLYEVKDRTLGHKTAAASGLYLKHVYYEGDDPAHPTKLPAHQR